MERTMIVISDLHVGENDDFDIFASPGKTEMFSSFLKYLREQTSPVELVVNGDFVDFLQLRPWDSVTRAAAIDKIRRITLKNSSVFASLSGFLADPRHSMKILLGNHDPELAYSEVGQPLCEAITQTSPEAKTRLFLERDRTTYNPRLNGVLVHIEHGNDQDPWNDVNYQQLFNDAETGTNNYYSPPGTDFVYKTMNRLKEQLKFVDVLKPEMPAIAILLVALRPAEALRAIPGAALEGLDAVVNGLLAALRRKVAGPRLGTNQAAEPAAQRSPLERAFDESVGILSGDLPKADDIEEFLASEEIKTDGKPTLAPRLDKVKLRLLTAALSGLARYQAGKKGDTFYTEDQLKTRDALRAQTRLKGEVKIVLFGHTHEALKAEFPQGVYVNSGTWADLVSLPTGDEQSMLAWLHSLSDNSFKRTSFSTFVRIDPSDSGAMVSLNVWREGQEHQLWRKDISR